MRKKRKKWLIWITRRGAIRAALAGVVAVFLALVLSYDFPAIKTWLSWSLPLSGKVIAVDAGHGGADGGAVSAGGVQEKHITLAIAKDLRDYLQEAGAIVVMTRETDRDLADEDTRGLSRRKTEDLLRRVDKVRSSRADALISIHLNSIPSSRWHGAQTFFYPQNEEGKKLAVLIQEEIKKNLGNTDREANTVDSVYLLKTLTIPAALVEVGFLSNPQEAQLMTDAGYQKKVAASIYRGILRFAAGEQPAPSS